MADSMQELHNHSLNFSPKILLVFLLLRKTANFHQVRRLMTVSSWLIKALQLRDRGGFNRGLDRTDFFFSYV